MKVIKYLPTLGIVIFAIFYFTAASQYPGGSNWSVGTKGFNLWTNYWCDLVWEAAKNGQPNPARPIALTGIGFLCLALALFFFLTPRYFRLPRWVQIGIQISGVLTMALIPLIFDEIFHDTALKIVSFSAIFALVGTLVGLYRTGWYRLLAMGFLCIGLIGLNQYIYFGLDDLSPLPFIQKVAFFTVLLWVATINIKSVSVGR